MDEILVQNQATLQELAETIEWSVGEFHLLIARCNYCQVRSRLLNALQAQCNATLLIVSLTSDHTNLLSQIQAAISEDLPSTNSAPAAIMVTGFEHVTQVDQLFATADQAREEFRKTLPHPLVFWFDDQRFQVFNQHAPNLATWAPVDAPVFTLPGAILLESLRHGVEKMYQTALDPQHMNLPTSLKAVDPLGHVSRHELTYALNALHRDKLPLEPDLDADLNFLQGLNTTATETTRQNPNRQATTYFQRSIDYWRESIKAEGRRQKAEIKAEGRRQKAEDEDQNPKSKIQNPKSKIPSSSLKLAIVLFFLGRHWFWATDALRRQDSANYNSEGWHHSRRLLEESIRLFEQCDRPDMVAKVIRRFQGTLRRLEDWQGLTDWSRRAVRLHQTYGTVDRLAMAYGFGAEAALNQDRYEEAQGLAQQALTTLAQVPKPQRWAEGLYLSLLGKAKRQLGEVEGAIALLQQARDLGDGGNPTIYSTILEELRQLYILKKLYLEAFKLKQQRLEVEKIAGIRAFVGAGRLGAVAAQIEDGQVAPEIYASGRQRDLERLLEWIGRSDHRLTVIHGDSGVGKSSLVNAGLVPSLERRAIGTRSNGVVLMRKYGTWIETLGDRVAEVFGDDRSQDLSGDRSRDLSGDRSRGSSVSPQVQTNNLPKEPRDLSGDRSRDLSGDRSRGSSISFQVQANNLPKEPRDLGARSRDLSAIAHTLQQCDHHNLRPVLIFDQFEEFFFANPNPLDRRRFFEFLADILPIPFVNVVLSLREDYIHFLLEANRLEGMTIINQDILSKNVLYPLGNFSPQETTAIIQDLTQRSRSYFEPDLVKALVQDLAGELQQVRPIELQIVGAQMETEKMRSLDQYQALGDEPKEELVNHYLQDVVDDCGPEYSQLAELVIYLLTDERGTRPLKVISELHREVETFLPQALQINKIFDLSLNEFRQEPSGNGINNTQNPEREKTQNILSYVLRVLCGSGLVHYFPEEPEGRYQLVHDYVAETFRSRYNLTLHKKLIETEEERSQLFRSNQILSRARQKARNLLRTTLGISAISLFAIIFFANVVNQRTETRKREIELAAKIEQDSSYALQQFEFSQIDALVKAIESGQELNKLIKANDSLEDYPALTPFFALQKIINQIQEKNRIDIGDGEVLWAGFSPNGQYFAISTSSGLVQVRDISGRAVSSFITCKENPAWSLSFLENTKIAIACAPSVIEEPGLIEIWSQHGQKISSWEAHQGGVANIDFNSDSNTLVSVGQDGYIRKWTESGELVSETIAHSGAAYWVRVSPDFQKIVTVGKDGLAKLWNINTQVIDILSGHKGAVTSVDFSPDGKTLVTTGENGTAKLWNLGAEELSEFAGHHGAVTNVSFFPDGERIVTVGDDGVIRVWNRLGQELFKLHGHQNRIWGINFSPDGRAISF